MKYIAPEIYRQEIEELAARAVEYNEIIGLQTPGGNAVLMSQEEYDALMETVHIMRDPDAVAAILDAATEVIEECIAEEDVDWEL